MTRILIATVPVTLALVALALVALAPMVGAAPADRDADLQHSVEQLRSTAGQWSVVTEFLNEDGSVARKVAGTYDFSWVVPDRVLVGKSEIPELEQAAGILFFVNPLKKEIEMVSVGADGMLWRMVGPLGGETRITQEYKTAGGGSGQLRFTRSNVQQDSFESRMEYTEDQGKTWKPGNHQVFTRVESADP